jgi:hypothetical protein
VNWTSKDWERESDEREREFQERSNERMRKRNKDWKEYYENKAKREKVDRWVKVVALFLTCSGVGLYSFWPGGGQQVVEDRHYMAREAPYIRQIPDLVTVWRTFGVGSD